MSKARPSGGADVIICGSGASIRAAQNNVFFFMSKAHPSAGAYVIICGSALQTKIMFFYCFFFIFFGLVA